MAGIARAKGMQIATLLTRSATRANVLKAIRRAAKKLKSGDLFFLTYSGHGGQVRDRTSDEEDGMDETWCLYDGELIDDELYFELSRFAAGVRVLVLSDSCHSGTAVRLAPPAAEDAHGRPRSRMMPLAIARQVYEKHKAFYDALQMSVAKRAGKQPSAERALTAGSSRLAAIAGRFKPAAILISGCQDNQTSMDGVRNGAFTEQLLRVWSDGAFKKNYARFHAAIRQRLPSSQSPNLFTLGRVARFLAQQPFTV
jgi:hypothetical protein